MDEHRNYVDGAELDFLASILPLIAPFPSRSRTMSSGVAVADECKAIFEEIKKSKKYRYAIFHIKDEKVISVESQGDRDAAYDDFLTDLQKGGDGECRYGLYDFEYEHQCQVGCTNKFGML